MIKPLRMQGAKATVARDIKEERTKEAHKEPLDEQSTQECCAPMASANGPSLDRPTLSFAVKGWAMTITGPTEVWGDASPGLVIDKREGLGRKHGNDTSLLLIQEAAAEKRFGYHKTFGRLDQ